MFKVAFWPYTASPRQGKSVFPFYVSLKCNPLYCRSIQLCLVVQVCKYCHQKNKDTDEHTVSHQEQVTMFRACSVLLFLRGFSIPNHAVFAPSTTGICRSCRTLLFSTRSPAPYHQHHYHHIKLYIFFFFF